MGTLAVDSKDNSGLSGGSCMHKLIPDYFVLPIDESSPSNNWEGCCGRQFPNRK